MNLLNVFADFVQKDGAERAAFEAAFVELIETKGYKMSDLIYDVFCCQKKIAFLEEVYKQKDNKACKMPVKA